LNKVRKLAEDLVNKNPTLFTNDFNVNKRAMDQVIMIRNRALRNQIAGAISVLVRERTPEADQAVGTSGEFGSQEQQSQAPEENVVSRSANSSSVEDVTGESGTAEQSTV
jgi:ribosomal protein S17E